MDILKLYRKAKEKGIDFEIRTGYFRNTLVITATKESFRTKAAITMNEDIALNFPVENRIEFTINQLINEVDENEKRKRYNV